MKTNYQLINALFNSADMVNEEAKNLQVNAYKVRIDNSIASIEAICINEYGSLYSTNDVRNIAPSKKQLNRLQKLGDFFFVYEED